jgi:hypothetical protein
LFLPSSPVSSFFSFLPSFLPQDSLLEQLELLHFDDPSTLEEVIYIYIYIYIYVCVCVCVCVCVTYVYILPSLLPYS